MNEYSVGDVFMLNPVLIIFSIGSLCALNFLLKEKVFKQNLEPEKIDTIEFISDRKKISLQTYRIKYIESNDSEV